MSYAINRPRVKTAAWRISLWGTAAFAAGTIILFLFLHQFVAHEIQRRADSWLTGEVGTLGDVAEKTPQGVLYDRIVSEVAELATKEVPHGHEPAKDPNRSVFFLQTNSSGHLKLWVGEQNKNAVLQAVHAKNILPGHPVDIHIPDAFSDFRVASTRMNNGDVIYLGLSGREENRTLDTLRLYFFIICLGIVLLGFLIIFFTTKRMLGHVQRITDTAATIGHDDLRSRVPEVEGNDEVAQLAFTLNRMLDRVENTVRQLHTITDSLAHDLRSPITAVRGRLEAALLRTDEDGWAEPVASAIDELDRLCEFLTKSLDVAEAGADALRLQKEPVNLDELLQTMAHLYEPSMAERGLSLTLRSSSPVIVDADPSLIHRMMMNLFDNELKHLPPGCSVHIRLQSEDGHCNIFLEDNGPGFPDEVAAHIFEKYAKGSQSAGSGLGLAFVEAVVRAHNGSIEASNLPSRGIQIRIRLQRSSPASLASSPATSSHTGV
jgi:signal transduction histidine kinase